MNELIKVNEHMTVVLLDKKEYTDRLSIVLCAILGRREYVTWIMNNDNKSMFNGHYHNSLFNALEEYNNRRY